MSKPMLGPAAVRVVADAAERAREPDPFAAVGRFVHAAADERIAVLCPLLSGRPAEHGAGLSAPQVANGFTSFTRSGSSEGTHIKTAASYRRITRGGALTGHARR